MLVIVNLLMLVEMELLLKVTCKNVAVVILLLIDSTEVLTSVHLQVVHSTRVDILVTRNLCAVVIVDVVHDRLLSSRSRDVVIMMTLHYVREPSTGSCGGGTVGSLRRRLLRCTIGVKDRQLFVVVVVGSDPYSTFGFGVGILEFGTGLLTN